MAIIRRFLAVAAAITTTAILTSAVADEGAKELAPPTHKQVRTITPMLDGESLLLNTFCLKPDGDLLLCCGPRATTGRNAIGRLLSTATSKTTSSRTRSSTAGWILVYTPEGEVRRTVPLDFVPTAINLSPQGDCFVAGDGHVCRLNSSLEITASSSTPNIQDMDAFKKRVVEGLREQYRQRAEAYAKQIDLLDTRIKAITDIPEDERTDQQVRMLRSYQASRERYPALIKQMKKQAEGEINVDAMLRSKLRVTGLAANERDVFISCAATEGYGYDIWRVDQDLQNPMVLLKGVRGCCGQMDIQCCGANLLVAENTKFAVTTYDRDGKQVSTFGNRDPKSINGFGSCCNPMNVLQTSDGAILTAESSIGNIKKYDTQGNLLAYIGKAKIGGGCKHCAIGFDEKRDRYYMQHEDAHHICVLVPVSDAPEMTADEQQAKVAREGLGRKLIGTWELESPSDKPATTRRVISTRQPAKMFEFGSDGELKMTGGIYSSTTGVKWRAIKQSGNTLDVGQVVNLVESYHYRIEFNGDNEATISMLYNDSVMSSGKYRRAQ